MPVLIDFNRAEQNTTTDHPITTFEPNKAEEEVYIDIRAYRKTWGKTEGDTDSRRERQMRGPTDEQTDR